MKVLILAGGNGTRLWPLSRDRYPKQFIKLLNLKTSLFQETFKRSLLLADISDIYVITNNKYKYLVMGEVEELGFCYNEANILVEPEAKNTLPAIYYGVHEIQSLNSDTVLVFPSDHMIQKTEEFVSIIKASERLVADSILTFGIKPDSPNTAYGYISPGETKGNGYVVREFKEKPDLDTALVYLSEGYLWNSGIFMFNSDIFAEELKLHSNDIFRAFNTSDSIQEAYSKIEKGISIDYGVMEKTSRAVVVPVDVNWNDLGSFDAFYEAFEKDENNNIINDTGIAIESKNNIVHSEKEKIVAVIGVEDLIVIDKRDALLICKKEKSQKVKDVVNMLKERKDLRIEYHIEDYRPWGYYKVLEEEKNSYKIKKITVMQGKKISYQLHHHRSEHWIVVCGTAKVTIDGVEQYVRAGESIFMKAGQKHRLENPGKTLLEIIEVQMGSYLEEDDIIRFDDEFGRS